MTTVAKVVTQGFNLVGMALVFAGLYGFYQWSQDPRTFTPQNCAAKLIAGSLLLISSVTYTWTMNTASDNEWESNSSMLAVGSHINEDIETAKQGFLGKYLPENSVRTLMGFVYLIGLFGYLRGVYLLKDIGSSDSNRSGGFWKAMWHMIGGAATMNILDVGCWLSDLFGIALICAE